jgi:murein DD-endopeptidase MepM/ murein hydrolase activator NlpD
VDHLFVDEALVEVQRAALVPGVSEMKPKKFAGIILFCMLSACAPLEFSGAPPLGMKFRDPYPPQFGAGRHAGLDLDVPLGTPVRSIADGEVISAITMKLGSFPTNLITIRHADEVRSRYIHIEKMSVKPFDKVRQGDQIAVTALNGPSGPGSNRLVTYPHLHLEIYKNGELVDPLLLPLACGTTKWRWPVGCKEPK